MISKIGLGRSGRIVDDEYSDSVSESALSVESVAVCVSMNATSLSGSRIVTSSDSISSSTSSFVKPCPHIPLNSSSLKK